MSKVEIVIENCTGNEYVLFPACAYNGNRFKSVKREYPPMFNPNEASVNMEITITDVPRLNKDGSGKIEVTTGDVATPCIAVFNQIDKKAVFVYTIQQIDGENIGLAYKRGVITLTYPAYREETYIWPFMRKNTVPYKDTKMKIPYEKLEYKCENMEEFYKIYFNNRNIMNLDDKRAETISFSEQFQIQKNKFNSMNWIEDEGFYDVDTNGSWQAGWIGGGMVGYPLMKLGGELEKERAIKTLAFLFKNQSPSGLFYGFDNKKGDGFDNFGCKNWTMVRKSGDCLYFIFKHFELMKNVPHHFIEGTKKLTDFFVSLWDKYGQFGQFVDCETGEIAVGNSTSGAIIPAGLARASKYFNNEKYLNVAKQSAEMMYKRDALNGYTTGGPGEILQCPDSESAFSLFESMVILYEISKEKKWLEYAEFLCHFCSSWVVSYNYEFPSGSEFNKLDMKTVGTVFANVQNKHSAPGICTLSGNSIYKLYKWTNNEKYLELYKDIALTIGQYISTDKKPIFSWDVPKDATTSGKVNEKVEREKLPSGFICERVNMSDWETKRCVGGVFCGSCWCETSNLLTMAEFCLEEKFITIK